ncbi:MAG TPA: DUF1153 domain-containing protein [Micropepsaceae bacterium]|nr:DUF1153 domain-containing protein [Micropepsaceae bacterium]
MAKSWKVRKVIGPDGGPITLGDLPPVKPQRWSPRRKAIVVAAVRGGLITAEEVCRRYDLSVEEFTSWQSGFDRLGIAGLKVTRNKSLH